MRLIATLILISILVMSATSAMANAAENTFVITYWFGPELTDTRYAEVAGANFTVAGPPAGAVGKEENIKYLDLCQKQGIKGMVHDPRVMAKNPGTPGFEENLDGIIADYSKHPALYGYFLMDEPGPGIFPLLAGISRYLLKKDPAHVPYLNIFPNYVEQWPQAIDNLPYAEYVERYLSEVKPSFLAYDHYALFEGYERDSYFENLEIIRTAAQKHGIPWMSTVLSTPHYDYRDPREADLRWQAYTNMAYGGRGIGYYTYWTPAEVELGYRNGIIGRDGKRTEHYEMVKRVNGEMKALAPTLLKLKSTGVYHTGALPIGTKPLPQGTVIKSAVGADMVIGLFEGPKKSNWLMLVNRSPRKAALSIVRFAKPQKVSEVDKISGKLKPVSANSQANPTIQDLKFEPGEGRLFLLSPTVSISKKVNSIAHLNIPFEDFPFSNVED